MAPLSGEAVRLLFVQRTEEGGCRVPRRPHSMRHAGANEIARRGRRDQLMAYGGWQTFKVAARYIEERQETQIAAMALVEM
jgi:hypothetical protein